MGDIHSGSGYETKNLPHGYMPAAVPNIDRTGTQKEAAPEQAPEAETEDNTTAGSTPARKGKPAAAK
jgi:hypothetical protein